MKIFKTLDATKGQETLKKLKDVAAVLRGPEYQYQVSVHKVYDNDRGQSWLAGGRIEISWE